jgi:hypothetical protein
MAEEKAKKPPHRQIIGRQNECTGSPVVGSSHDLKAFWAERSQIVDSFSSGLSAGPLAV